MDDNIKQHNVTIPDDVLYCKKISSGAKLLYIEIAFICKRDGYCDKENKYFGKLFGKRKETISLWVKSLLKMHFIKCERKQKYVRVIFLKDTDKNYIKKVMQVIAKNLKGDSEKSKDIPKVYRGPRLDDEDPLDDYLIESVEFINKEGQKCVEDSIDYES